VREGPGKKGDNWSGLTKNTQDRPEKSGQKPKRTFIQKGRGGKLRILTIRTRFVKVYNSEEGVDTKTGGGCSLSVEVTQKKK